MLITEPLMDRVLESSKNGQIIIAVSQPMSKVSERDVLQKRYDVFNKFKKIINDELTIYTSLKVNIIDTYSKNLNPYSFLKPDLNERMFCLGDSIKLMSFTDLIIFAKGWESARGCRIEQKIVDEYYMNYTYETVLDQIIEERGL